MRKNQFVLMSPQRIDEKIVKIYEILPEGIEKIDKTEKEGFGNLEASELKSEIEIISLINEIIKEINNSEMIQLEKDSILEKLIKIKNKLAI